MSSAMITKLSLYQPPIMSFLPIVIMQVLTCFVASFEMEELSFVHALRMVNTFITTVESLS
jgi:hypothetical protein